MNNANICILILSTRVESYSGFITSIENSWYKEAINKGFKVFFYSGGYSENCIYSHNEIRVTEADSLENCYKKFVSAKDVLLAHYPEVKLIYRTNLSSYIDIRNFSKYITECSFSSDSYHGLQGKANLWSEIFFKNRYFHLLFKYFFFAPKISFFSGAGFFIGTKLCNTLSFDDSKKYLIDDVEIGRQILSFEAHNVKYERIYITDSFTKMKRSELDVLLNHSLLFHYKFKTSNRNNDIDNISKFSDVHFRNDFLSII
jgi:hypothetical protein